MKYPHLKGLRYANWARRSDAVQDTSIEDQLRVNNDFAAEHEMFWVRNFVFEDTGSVPGARDDIPTVIEACSKDNIPVLLLHDVSRLTRSGIEHGMKVLYDLKSEGIEVAFVRDDIPGGEWAPLFQTLLLFAAKRTISQILRNPIYTGRGLANSYTQAVYVVRNHGQPIDAKVKFKELAKRKRPQRRRRPERDWFWREEPQLRNFLPPEIKALAEEYQRKHLDRIKSGHTPKPGGDPHADSPYVLKNILQTPNGAPLVGCRLNGNRYYGMKYVEGQRRRFVRAEPIEQAVLGVLRDVLLAENDLRGRISSFVTQEAAVVCEQKGKVCDIQQQADRLLTKIEFLMDRVTTETKNLTERKIREAEEQLAEVNRRLRNAEAEIPPALLDVDGATEVIVSRLQQIGKDLSSQKQSSLHRLLRHLVDTLVIDLETLKVEVRLRLPATSGLLPET